MPEANGAAPGGAGGPLTLRHIRDQQRDLAAAGGWEALHTPRNLLCVLVRKVGRLAEIFQWKGEVAVHLEGWGEGPRAKVDGALAECLNCLARLGDRCGVDLAEAVLRKLEKNDRKYPADLVKGSSKKYTEYSEEERQASAAATEAAVPPNGNGKPHGDGALANGITAEVSAEGGGDAKGALSLRDIRERQREFAVRRDWDQFHSPRNLLCALVGEVGELAELFQWRGEAAVNLDGWSKEDRVKVEDEMADCLNYLVRLSDRCGVDLDAAVLRRLEASRREGPAESEQGPPEKRARH